MKLTHNNITKIEEYLTSVNKSPIIENKLIYEIYDNVIAVADKQIITSSKKKRHDAVMYQLDSIKRDLVKIAHKTNNYSSSGIKAGYVYAITNPAWPGYYKIGSAIDVNDRLNSYQTSSPLRDYKLEIYAFSEDRVADEKRIHLSFSNRINEWCFSSELEIRELFKNLRKQYRVPVLDKYYCLGGEIGNHSRLKICR